MSEASHFRGWTSIHRFAAIICFAVVFFPTVTGSGTLETPVLVIHFENQFGGTCSPEVLGFCAADVQGDGTPQNLTVDAYQRVAYVGVATDFSLFREHAGEHWLLPDQSMTVRGSDLYVRYPFLRMLTETWQEVPQASEEYWVVLTPSGVNLLYYGPPTSTPTGDWEQQNRTYGYARPEEGKEGVGYEQAGPFNTPTGNSTDGYAGQIPNGTCAVKGPVPDSECRGTAGGLVNASRNLTPNVWLGLEFYDLQVATDPGNLTYGSNSTRSAGGLSPVWKMESEDSDVTAVSNDSTRGPLEAIEEALPRHGSSEPSTPPPPKEEGRVDVLAQAPPVQPPRLPLRTLLVGAAAGILAAVGAALYSRFNNRNDLLRSETRTRLVQLVRENPGICVAEAARSLGLAWNAARYHVKMLERLRIIEVMNEGGRKALRLCKAPPNAVPAWVRRNPIANAVFAAVLASPDGLDRKRLREILPQTPERTRNHNIRRLIGAGVLRESSSPSGERRLQAVHPASGST